MATNEPFRVQPPRFFTTHSDSQVRIWINLLHRYLNGNTEDSKELTTTQDTQGETQTTQATSITTIEAQLALIANSLPAYTITSDTIDRSWDANRAVVGTGVDVTTTGTAALLTDHDALVLAVQELSDVVATLVKDLGDKNVLGTQ